MALPLSNATLAELPDGIERPSYDRSALRPGIVHIGLGNFHRAHQAWYLHRLMQVGLAKDWAVIGAGVRPADARMRDLLLAQDGLSALIELDPRGTRVEVTGVMIDFLPVEPGNAALIWMLSDPAIRIVSLTVTEGGYYQRADGGFDADHPDMRHDSENPDHPHSAFGAMIAALKARRAAGHPPFTGQSCDNLQGNGDVLCQTLTGLARLSDPDLADWIAAEMAFPNSMVDCIVPATGAAEIALAGQLGIDSPAPVTHEPFRQWVIEDRFPTGRPPWEQAGATITRDVHGYEAMKIRILNAGHQLLANAGELLGLPTIAACMADSDVARFFRKVEIEEILPHVVAVPEIAPAAYLDQVETRFANPRIRDTTRRVAFDGAARHSGFLMPILRDRLAAGRDVTGLALAQALWARMCAGTREDGTEIAPNDPHWDALKSVALEARARPVAWLDQRHLYGELGQNPAFRAAFEMWLARLWADGCRATLQDWV